MTTPKYFDHNNNRPIDIDKDGCSLNDWKKLQRTASFAKHPKGFPVFVPPHELEGSDEYSKSDPYTVEERIDSNFHRRRIECTLQMIEEATNNIKRAPRILDIGCGQGHITYKILQAVPDAEVSGFDYSISAIEYAAEHFSGIDFAVGNAYQCPYSENYFDIVVCNNLWEHVPDPLLLLSRITRSLKHSGFIIISTPSRYRLGNLVNVLRGKSVIFMSEHHVTEYSVGQVVEQLRYGGYEVKKIFSRPIREGSLKLRIVNPFFYIWVSMVGSHHQLESTVFYLAQRTNKAP